MGNFWCIVHQNINVDCIVHQIYRSCIQIYRSGYRCRYMYLAPVQVLVSSNPHILRFMCTCLYPRILTSSYFQVHVLQVLVGILASSHPHILRFMYSGFWQVSSHPHILISLGSCTLGACWYSFILTSSYPYVHVLPVLVDFLASSHPHILTFMYSGYFLVSSHPHILRFQSSYLFRKLESDKTMVLRKKRVFMKTNNGSNKCLTK